MRQWTRVTYWVAVMMAAAIPAFAQPGEWRSYASPAEAGFDARALEDAKAFAETNRSAAVMAVYRGHVLAAWGPVDRPFMVHSVRKSLAGALYGQAISDGRLRLSDTLTTLGIDDEPRLSDSERQATFGDLVAARSGVYHRAAYADAGQDRDRPARGSHAPGTHFFYNNWDFNVAERAFELKTGEDLFAAFDRRIARPLGMQDYDLARQFEVLEPSQSRLPAHTMRVSTRDLARFGQLYLQRGVWDGKQIVPASWIEASWTRHSANPDGSGYGYLWWIFEAGSLGANYPTLNGMSVYLARGTGGQTIFVIPSAEMVIVHRGDTDNGRSVQGPAIWQLVERLVAARPAQPPARPRLVPMVAVPLSSSLPEPATPATVPLTAQMRSAVVGEYVDPANPSVMTRVFDHDGRLFMALPGQGEAELFATGPLSYIVRVQPGVVVTFQQEDGVVTAVETRIGPRTFRAIRRRAEPPPTLLRGRQALPGRLRLTPRAEGGASTPGISGDRAADGTAIRF